MSDFSIKSHPIWAQLNQIQQWEGVPNFADPGVFVNEQYAYSRDKFFATAKVLRSFLEQTPALLISIHGLNQIHGNFQHCINEVANFVANNNAAHLVNAANHIDSTVMPTMWAFLPRLNEISPQTIGDIVQQVRDNSARAIDFFRSQKESLGLDLEQLRSEISSQRNVLIQLTDAISIQKNEALAINARLQQEFAEAETRRHSTSNEKIAEISASAEQVRDNFANSAKQSLESLAQNEQDARRIVQVVGNIGATGNFQKIATDESSQANLWRWITIGLFALGIAVAMVTFYKFLEKDFTPEHAWTAVIRLLYAIAITAPAWYAAKESARHRSNADSARRTELELASLGPFIELMPQEKKISIREALVGKYFGNAVRTHEIDPVGAELKDFALEAIKALKK